MNRMGRFDSLDFGEVSFRKITTNGGNTFSALAVDKVVISVLDDITIHIEAEGVDGRITTSLTRGDKFFIPAGVKHLVTVYADNGMESEYSVVEIKR